MAKQRAGLERDAVEQEAAGETVEEFSGGSRVMTRSEAVQLAKLPGMKEELADLKTKLRMATEQLEIYEREMSRTNPELVLRRIPEPLKEYDERLPAKVLALAWTGMHVVEIITELGMSVEQWYQWRSEHPAFRSASDRGAAMAATRFMRRARHAIETNNHKFPIAKLETMIRIVSEGLGGEDSRGDASQLIKLDLSRTEEVRSGEAGEMG